MIYPVSIQEWYVDEFNEEGRRNPFHECLDDLREILPYLKCEKCGSEITEKDGFVMHSITFGGPSGAWCSEKCLNDD